MKLSRVIASRAKTHAVLDEIIKRHSMLFVLGVRQTDPTIMTTVRGTFAESGMGVKMLKNSLASRVIRGEDCKYLAETPGAARVPAHALDGGLPADLNRLLVTEAEEQQQRERLEREAQEVLLSRQATQGEASRAGLTRLLVGQTALVYTNEDPAKAAKAMFKYADQYQDVFSLLGGTLQDSLLDIRELKALIKLAPRHELAAGLVAALRAPVRRAVSGLRAPVRVAASKLRGVPRAPTGKLARALRAPGRRVLGGLGAAERRLGEGGGEGAQ